MPDRLIRAELFESERWLGLPDAQHRLLYLCLLMHADVLGNLEHFPAAIWRRTRDITGFDLAATQQSIDKLVECDLARQYEVTVTGECRNFLHLPRTRFAVRYIATKIPPSPWTTFEEKQILDAQNSRKFRKFSERSPPKDKDKDYIYNGLNDVPNITQRKPKNGAAITQPVDNFGKLLHPVDNYESKRSTVKKSDSRSEHAANGKGGLATKGNGAPSEHPADRWTNGAYVLRVAKALGLTAATGETAGAFRQRVRASLNAKIDPERAQTGAKLPP